jgi:GNAT superfamily N-acetyltransferase
VTSNGDVLRQATSRDRDAVLHLWASLFEDADAPVHDSWADSARGWFTDSVGEPDTARFPVIEVAGRIVATAIGSLEIGVPNPWCPRGRTVRLANVFTRPSHRNQGFATMLVLDIVTWARRISADRVDLSATAIGQRLYDKVGFVRTSAPRMKLVL